jgi:hypothetical protein
MTASLGNFIASLFAGAFIALTTGGVLVLSVKVIELRS